MVFYQAVTILFLTILPFFPVQIDIKVIYGVILLALFLLPVFVKNVRADIKQKRATTIFFLLFLLAGAISTIFSIDQKRSFLQLLLYISYFIIFTSTRTIFPDLKSKNLFSIFCLLLSIILSALSLYHTLILHYVNLETSGVSFMWRYFGHNHLSALLIFALPIAIYLLLSNWQKWRLRLLLLFTIYYLLFSFLFTFGVGSIISLSLSILIVFFLLKNISPAKKLLIAAAVAILLGSFLLGTIYLPSGFGLKKNSISSVKTRFMYWRQVLNNFEKYPLTGSGLDTFLTTYTITNNQFRLKGDYTLNFFLQMLSDAGILGFLTSLGLIGSVLWKAGKKVFEIRNFLHVALFVGLLASTINAFTDFDWQIPMVFLLFWIIAAFI